MTLPAGVAIAALALLAAWLTVRAGARRLPASTQRLAGARLLDAALAGLLSARAGFVIAWWPDYAAAPRALLAIGDGGYLWWVGLPAALAFAWWRSADCPALRRPLLAGLATGMLAWLALNAALDLRRQSAPPLPQTTLTTLDGAPTTLQAHAGRPVVLNLWATWCPPCVREMPVFAEAQRRYPQLAFVLVNQGENRTLVEAFLNDRGLALAHVLLDPHSRSLQDTGARALPTTLFFDADGRLVHSHLGELTRASLASTLARHFAVTGDTGPQQARPPGRRRGPDG